MEMSVDLELQPVSSPRLPEAEPNCHSMCNPATSKFSRLFSLPVPFPAWKVVWGEGQCSNEPCSGTC